MTTTEVPSEKTGSEPLPTTDLEEIAIAHIQKAKHSIETIAREMLTALTGTGPNDRAIALESLANACYTHLTADLIANSAFQMSKSKGQALKVAADIVKHALKRTEWSLKTSVGPKVTALCDQKVSEKINPPTDMIQNRKARAKQQFTEAKSV